MDRMTYLEKRIRPKQRKLKNNLVFSDAGASVWTKSDKELSKGCQACKSGTWICLFVGHKCNLECSYCPQGTFEDKNNQIDDDRAFQSYWIDDVKFQIQLMPKGSVTGVSYSGGEPFMYMSKIINMATFLTQYRPEIYQWIYTNGLIADKNKVSIISELGISEIRFHLGASEFHDRALNNLKDASKIMKITNVESPSTPYIKEQLINNDYLKWLEDNGVQQLNLSELYLNQRNPQEPFASMELYAYTSMARGYNLSPTCSREITYDIINYACQKNINILINDCSHESRDVQIIKKKQNPFSMKKFS